MLGAAVSPARGAGRGGAAALQRRAVQEKTQQSDALSCFLSRKSLGAATIRLAARRARVAGELRRGAQAVQGAAAERARGARELQRGPRSVQAAEVGENDDRGGADGGRSAASRLAGRQVEPPRPSLRRAPVPPQCWRPRWSPGARVRP
jgi:hypothetical protein